jgi:hypothetical protein
MVLFIDDLLKARSDIAPQNPELRTQNTRMRKQIWPSILVSFLLCTMMYGQTSVFSNLRTQTLYGPKPASFTLDSLFVLPATVQLKDKKGDFLPASAFRLEGRTFKWLSPPASDRFPVQISYRVLPYVLDEKIAHLDSSIFSANEQEEQLMGWYRPPASEDWLQLGSVNSSGTFARSLAFGNNQDLVLNSRFNMQLAGKLGNDIELNAAITDENIPIQPEGNTQTLREFDKIFVQLKKDKTSLIAGDYELARPNSHFINYFKKLQGVSVKNESRINDRWRLSSDASLAIARGKFARNFLQQQEGNQGPYPLQGAENERFIIILSGTERVWLDGRLLIRGIDQDYIIDYNRGEITFTNQILITKDSRIIVEFDYTDQQFLRSLTAFNSSLQSDQFELRLHFIAQQDSKTPSRTSRLTDAEKIALQQAGDQINNAFSNAIDTLQDLGSARVSYQYADTLINCNGVDSLYSILVLNENPEEQTPLLVQFTFVGEGNGHYAIDNSKAANERVFKWVAPDPLNCRPRGSYSPTRPLIAPKQQAMGSLGASWQINENNSLHMELSWSQEDLNRFSSLDSEDDQGYAFLSSWESARPLGDRPDSWKLSNKLQYEFRHRHFQPLSPYRSPEFLRDWNLLGKQNEGFVPPASENLISGAFSLTKAKLANISYDFSYFNRDTLYNGIRHTFDATLKNKSWDIQAFASLVRADALSEQRSFLRPKLSIIRTLHPKFPWRIGLYTEIESNRRQNQLTDSLSNVSFKYELMRVFLESPDQFHFSLSQRRDFQPDGDQFATQTLAREANLRGALKINKNLSLDGNLTYRQLEVEDPFNDRNLQAGETYLGRVDNRLVFAKGAIRANTTYELGSGQEPRREFTFIRVIRGEGTHIWLDSLYNNDGVIQPNEMEIAPFRDQADFVKVATFSNEFIRTNYVNLNQSLQLNPKAVWFGKKGVRKMLSRFAFQGNLKISRKTQEGSDVAVWNPFELALADTNLIALRSGIRNQLFFNRGNPFFDVQIGQIDNRDKFLQTTGFESKSRREWFLKSRVNINRTISIESSWSQGQNETLSELAANRNFRIQFYELDNQLKYFINQKLRFGLTYRFTDNQNVQADTDPARSDSHELKVDGTFSQSTKMSIRFDASFVQVNFDGNPNSPVGFAILNGLQKGQNFLWNLSLDRQLSDNLRLNIGYEGRKTGNSRVIHVGRAQVAAIF